MLDRAAIENLYADNYANFGGNAQDPARLVRGSLSNVQSSYRTRAKLWRWPGAKASWYFLTLPHRLGDEIRLVDAGPARRGFGALRVQATIGASTWRTSIFPSATHKSYLLPVKAQIRKAESLKEGKMVALQLEVNRAW